MKRFWHYMAAVSAVAAMVCPAHAYNGKNLNGKAVSVHYRNGGSLCGSGSGANRGSIVLYTLQNSAVTSRDTIYHREQGFAQYPAFNLAGTKIAFFRYGQGPGANGSCVSANGGKSSISIINPDGTGLINLCDLPVLPDGLIFPLDWPVGDWIYYEKPHATAFGNQGNSGLMIWRVNAVTGVSEKVCNLTHDGSGAELNCSYLHRFTMSLKGDHCAFMTYPKYACNGDGAASTEFFSHVNGIYKFPPPNGNLGGSACVGWRNGCNASISPSGKLVANYFAGWHDDMNLGSINYATANGGEIGNDDPSVGLPVAADETGHVWINPNTNSGCPVCVQSSKGNLTKWNGGAYIGQGAELIRWSVNSDKWVMQKIGMYKSGHADNNDNGSNQIVCNFMDSVAINISKNPVPPHNSPDDQAEAPYGTVFWNNCAGDLWVDDPASNPDKNKYEDLKGVWHTVGTTPVQGNGVGSPLESAPAIVAQSGSSPSVRISIQGRDPWSITVTGADGRTIRSFTGASAGEITVPVSSMSRGVCVVNVAQSGKHFVNRIVLSGR